NRGASIEGIPSFGGPPERISANGTLCREKSVRGHSERQLVGSASAVPRQTAVAAPSSAPNAIARGKLLPVKDATHFGRAFSISKVQEPVSRCLSGVAAWAAASRRAVSGPAGYGIRRFVDSPLHWKRLQALRRPVRRVRPTEHAGSAIGQHE